MEISQLRKDKGWFSGERYKKDLVLGILICGTLAYQTLQFMNFRIWVLNIVELVLARYEVI